MKPTSMYIRLDGIRIYAYHGVLPQENCVGAYYDINLRLATDFSRAAENDELEHTVNYAEVYELVKKEMQTPSKLLEHVAYRIAQEILNTYKAISRVEIALYKENPPMGAQCERVGVEAEYQR